MSLEAFTKVSEASRLLVEQGFSAQAVTTSLELVGRALKVDRALVYENGTGGTPSQRRQAALRHEWTPTPLDTFTRQVFPLHERAPAWVEVLSRGSLVWETLRDVPAPMQGFLETQKVQSIILCPITIGVVGGGHWWGLLRLDDCQQQRRWSSDELAVAKALARSFSGALRQDQRRSALEATRSSLRALVARCATTDGR